MVPLPPADKKREAVAVRLASRVMEPLLAEVVNRPRLGIEKELNSEAFMLPVNVNCRVLPTFTELNETVLLYDPT